MSRWCGRAQDGTRTRVSRAEACARISSPPRTLIPTSARPINHLTCPPTCTPQPAALARLPHPCLAGPGASCLLACLPGQLEQKQPLCSSSPLAPARPDQSQPNRQRRPDRCWRPSRPSSRPLKSQLTFIEVTVVHPAGQCATAVLFWREARREGTRNSIMSVAAGPLACPHGPRHYRVSPGPITHFGRLLESAVKLRLPAGRGVCGEA